MTNECFKYRFQRECAWENIACYIYSCYTCMFPPLPQHRACCACKILFNHLYTLCPPKNAVNLCSLEVWCSQCTLCLYFYASACAVPFHSSICQLLFTWLRTSAAQLFGETWRRLTRWPVWKARATCQCGLQRRWWGLGSSQTENTRHKVRWFHFWK